MFFSKPESVAQAIAKAIESSLFNLATYDTIFNILMKTIPYRKAVTAMRTDCGDSNRFTLSKRLIIKKDIETASKHAKARMHYVDGAKGILCFMIMFGHFWHIYFGIYGSSPLKNRLFDYIYSLPLFKHILTATFWLYAFLILSGYLISFSKVTSLKNLISKSIKRFLRLYIPILGACAFIFVIQESIGFHVSETTKYFSNNWFQGYYSKPLGISDIIRDSFRTLFSPSCQFNPPFWVIHDMYISSLLMYLCSYIDSVANKKTHCLLWVILFSSLYLRKQLITACVIGYAIGYYNQELRLFTKKLHVFIPVSIIGLFGVFFLYFHRLFPYVIDTITVYTLVHCFFLILISRFSFLQNILSAKFFLYMHKISFGVYAFHWPVICSFGTLVLLKCIQEQCHPLLIYFASLGCSIILTVAISIIYHLTIEKLTDKIISLF